MRMFSILVLRFFFHYPPTTAIYTLSLHDALPISQERNIFRSLTVEENLTAVMRQGKWTLERIWKMFPRLEERRRNMRSEEHTSELQSQFHLVCRLLLEKKKKNDMHFPEAVTSIDT